MIGRYIPDWLRHSPARGVNGFAILSGLEATVRGLLISVWPLVIYQALGTAEGVSRVYLFVGLASLAIGLMVPWAGRWVPRRWMYTLGCSFYLVSITLAVIGGPWLTPIALMFGAAATATVFVCLNAYVMDYIARSELSSVETRRMFFSAFSWMVGPILGVSLHKVWAPLPFLVAAIFVLILIATFWSMRLGNGKLITRARAPAPNPVAYLGRFLLQPRLIAGWSFAVIRSCGWWVYIVYLPIFCIENGLGDRIAAVAYSASNGMLFFAPLMLRWMRRRSVRMGVRTGFGGATLFFALSIFGWLAAPVAVIAMFAASFFLVLLDMCGGLPFLMAVKPSERTEMSAVYSSFRDVSGIVTPAVAWSILLILPLPGVFAACALANLAAFAIAGRLHPRLGGARGPAVA
jgi:hypothetical protein